MRPGFVTIAKSFDLGYGVRNISSFKLRLGKAFFVARVATEFGERVGNLPLRYAPKGGALSNPYDWLDAWALPRERLKKVVIQMKNLIGEISEVLRVLQVVKTDD